MANPEILQLDRPYDFLTHHAQATPTAEAVSLGSERLSYRELKAMVDQCGRALLARGVEPGDRVAYVTPPNCQFLVLLLGTLSIGAIAVGINPRYRRREIEHVVNDASPRLLFVRFAIGHRDLSAELDFLTEEQRVVEHVISLDGELARDGCETWGAFLLQASQRSSSELHDRIARTEPDTPGLIIYTSGTTGAPKGALLRQNAAVRHGKIFLANFRPEPLRVLNYYPTNHVAGVAAAALYTIVGGGALVCMESFDPAQVLATIESEGITQWGGVPTMFQLCVDHDDFDEADLSSVQLLSWGGSPASQGLLRTLATRVPRMSTLYAMSETTGGVTSLGPSLDVDLLSRSVGKPLPDVDLRLVDEDRKPVPTGTIGEVLLRGPFLMAGYWGNPEATAHAIDDDGWLQTGDLARRDEEGFLELAGRKTQMYKSGGYNVYPKEVELVIETHSSVRAATVVGVPDPLFGEVGVAFVIADFESREQGESAVLAHCRSELANYKVPKRVRLVREFPLLGPGKVDRKALSECAREELSGE